MLVVLPGLDGLEPLRGELLAALRARGVEACVVAYPADRPMDYPALEAHVNAALPDAPFVLLGESFSGPLAIRIAARSPPGLVGLVLSTTFARAPVPLTSLLAPWVRFAPTRLPASMLSWWLLGRWSTPALRSALAATLREVHPDVLRTRVVATLRVDVSRELAGIPVPVLQLVATDDRLLRPGATRFLASQLPHVRSLELPGPHLLLQTRTARCADEIVAFMRTCDRGFAELLRPGGSMTKPG